jgi:hypothetical protein
LHMQHDAFITLSVLRENWGWGVGRTLLRGPKAGRAHAVRRLAAAVTALMSGRCALPRRKASSQNHAARYTVITGCVADRIRLAKPRRQRALLGLEPLISCAGS